MRLTVPNPLGALSAGLLLTGMLTCAAAPSLWAEDVEIHTHFPSPYGSYGTIEVSGNSSFADRVGNTQLVPAGGRVAIGQANPETGTQRTLGVIGEIANEPTAAFLYTNGVGVTLGGRAGSTVGIIQAINAGGGPAVLSLNGSAGSGNVGIGITNPQYTLHVNGTVGITNGASQTGDVKVTYDATDQMFHPNYAP